jgi:hypothetical protein
MLKGSSEKNNLVEKVLAMFPERPLNVNPRAEAGSYEIKTKKFVFSAAVLCDLRG